MAASDFVDEALAVLGGEDTDFLMRVAGGRVQVSCRAPGCSWGELAGEMELWEFICDAREHWEAKHRG